MSYSTIIRIVFFILLGYVNATITREDETEDYSRNQYDFHRRCPVLSNKYIDMNESEVIISFQMGIISSLAYFPWENYDKFSVQPFPITFEFGQEKLSWLDEAKRYKCMIKCHFHKRFLQLIDLYAKKYEVKTKLLEVFTVIQNSIKSQITIFKEFLYRILCKLSINFIFINKLAPFSIKRGSSIFYIENYKFTNDNNTVSKKVENATLIINSSISGSITDINVLNNASTTHGNSSVTPLKSVSTNEAVNIVSTNVINNDDKESKNNYRTHKNKLKIGINSNTSGKFSESKNKTSAKTTSTLKNDSHSPSSSATNSSDTHRAIPTSISPCPPAKKVRETFVLQWFFSDWTEGGIWHDTEVLIAESDTTAVIVFRGSDSMNDFITNSQTMEPSHHSGHFRGCRTGSLHRGFLNAYTKVNQGYLVKLKGNSDSEIHSKKTSAFGNVFFDIFNDCIKKNSNLTSSKQKVSLKNRKEKKEKKSSSYWTSDSKSKATYKNKGVNQTATPVSSSTSNATVSNVIVISNNNSNSSSNSINSTTTSSSKTSSNINSGSSSSTKSTPLGDKQRRTPSRDSVQPPPPSPPGSKCKLRDELLSKLLVQAAVSALKSGKRLAIGGHSLGGALAMLLTLDVAVNHLAEEEGGGDKKLPWWKKGMEYIRRVTDSTVAKFHKSNNTSGSSTGNTTSTSTGGESSSAMSVSLDQLSNLYVYTFGEPEAADTALYEDLFRASAAVPSLLTHRYMRFISVTNYPLCKPDIVTRISTHIHEVIGDVLSGRNRARGRKKEEGKGKGKEKGTQPTPGNDKSGATTNSSSSSTIPCDNASHATTPTTANKTTAPTIASVVRKAEIAPLSPLEKLLPHMHEFVHKLIDKTTHFTMPIFVSSGSADNSVDAHSMEHYLRGLMYLVGGEKKTNSSGSGSSIDKNIDKKIIGNIDNDKNGTRRRLDIAFNIRSDIATGLGFNASKCFNLTDRGFYTFVC